MRCSTFRRLNVRLIPRDERRVGGREVLEISGRDRLVEFRKPPRTTNQPGLARRHEIVAIGRTRAEERRIPENLRIFTRLALDEQDLPEPYWQRRGAVNRAADCAKGIRLNAYAVGGPGRHVARKQRP